MPVPFIVGLMGLSYCLPALACWLPVLLLSKFGAWVVGAIAFAISLSTVAGYHYWVFTQQPTWFYQNSFVPALYLVSFVGTIIAAATSSSYNYKRPEF